MGKKIFRDNPLEIILKQKIKQQDKEMELLKEKINDVMPKIYASFVMTLKLKYGWDNQDIADVVAGTGVFWHDCATKGIDMLKWCNEETGIDCVQMVTEKQDYEHIELMASEEE